MNKVQHIAILIVVYFLVDDVIFCHCNEINYKQLYLIEKKLNTDTLKAFGKLEERENFLREFTKQARCPDKLRHAMEFIFDRFFTSPESSLQRQHEVNTRLSALTNYSTNVILMIQCSVRLSKIISESGDERKKKLRAAWEFLKSLKLDSSSLSESYSDEFGKALVDLYNTSDFDMVENLYNQQVNDVWTPRKIDLFMRDEKVIKTLCKRNMQSIETDLQSLKHNIFKTPGEFLYATHAIKFGLLSPGVSKHYKKICWLLYTCEHDAIERIKIKMGQKWPTLSRAECIDKYCIEYAHLYHIVSILGKHGPGIKPPIMIEPSQRDFDAYINHLAVTESEDLSFVAQTLYKPLPVSEDDIKNISGGVVEKK